MADINVVRQEIERICKTSDGNSEVFPYGTPGYYESLRHWVESSNQDSVLAVQPGSVSDLVSIVKVLDEHRVPFAVKCGGHAMCPGVSSTQGIHISLARFNQINYNAATETLDVGGGCVWDRVYDEIFKLGRNVVGGSRSEGVGVGGYLLGGGYSLKTNQHGLGIDNVVGFQVVLTTGVVVNVKEGDTEYKDLFEALKGGGNNFGIVTRFTLRTHVQGPVFRALLKIEKPKEEAFKEALAKFIATEMRPETAVVAAWRYILGQDQDEVDFYISLLCVWDGKAAFANPFTRLTDISRNTKTGIEYGEATYGEINKLFASPYQLNDGESATTTRTSTLTSQSTIPSDTNARGRFGCIMVSGYTRRLIDAVSEQARILSGHLKTHSGRLVLLDVWPFLPTIFDRSPPAAWPHTAGHPVSPLLAYVLWTDEAEDAFWLAQVQQALDAVRAVAIAEGVAPRDAPVYQNTSLETTRVQDIYRQNFEGLRGVRARYDPSDLLSKAGGFRISLPSA